MKTKDTQIKADAKGLEKLPYGSSLNKPKQMEKVKTMGKIDAKETTELLVALADVAVATKNSIDDDGKITGYDVMKFANVVLPVIHGIIGINKIPAEFKDGFDEVEKADMKEKVSYALQGISKNDAQAVDAGLDVIYALQKFFLVTGIIKNE